MSLKHLGIYTVQEMIDWTPPIQREIIGQGILPAGAGMVIFGEAGTWKSVLAMHLADHIATGRDWFGIKTDRTLTLRYQSELPMSVDRDRLMKYMNSHRPAGVLLKTTKERIALDTEYGIRKLDKELAEVRACYPGQHIVLIIDPIMAFMDGSVSDEYNVKKMLYGNLDEMKKKHGLSVIIIHHAHKNKYDATGRAITEGGNAGMGSMLFWAWCDTYIEMKLLNPFGEMDKVRFSFFKVRNATSLPPADFSVKWDRTTLKPSVYDRKERVDNQDGEQTEPTVRGLVGKDRNNGQGGG